MTESSRMLRRRSDEPKRWTRGTLKRVLDARLGSPEIIVVSSRQPYSHCRVDAGGIVVQKAAGGLVTALDPVLRVCSGTWVAQSSGSADREVVDEDGCIRVPAEEPAYTLCRVWPFPEDEFERNAKFCNEGLWPLCHKTDVPPVFEADQWEAYQRVNAKFADAVWRASSSASPVVLVQDYHLLLVPLLLRSRLPNASIALFWHIPWPDRAVAKTCPWIREMLRHALGADLVGFSTREYLGNFLASVDQFLQGSADVRSETVSLSGDHAARVAVYPISIEWPVAVTTSSGVQSHSDDIRSFYGVERHVFLGLGVDRWDFTKGILERLAAFETLLEKEWELRGTVTLLQLAAPSRSELAAYRALQQATREAVARINRRFETRAWKPVILIDRVERRERIFSLFRSADFCIVSSLHDGMNLIAKEFVASRDDEDGVLILSTQAGASLELREALLINPRDVSATADAILAALRMRRKERRNRMRRMRRTVKENNIYRWAGRLLIDLKEAQGRAQCRAAAMVLKH